MFKLLRKLILALALSLFTTSAFASENLEDLTIKDTSGFTRAVSQVDGIGSVEFNIVDAAGLPADAVEVSLTNAATGSTLNAVAANGTVIFDGVSSGVWTVASTSTEVTFTNVAITSGSAVLGGGATVAAGLGSLGGGAAAAAGAVGVGATTLAVSEASKSSSSSKALSPSS